MLAVMDTPLSIVIFGATGDLYETKLAHAFQALFSQGLLPSDVRIVGFGRRPLGDDGFRAFTASALIRKGPSSAGFLARCSYVQGDLASQDDFKRLGEYLSDGDASAGSCSNKLFYLAVPPPFYAGIFKNIAGAGLTVPCAPGKSEGDAPWTRVLVEKPFGKNGAEAERLDRMLGELFDESQVFRIDHYLAKEAMQNILAFRFANPMFSPLWNKNHIERVRIVVHEERSVGTRGAFYDGVGALRDVGQNHMLQMLALVAMEEPRGMGADAVRSARAAVLGEVGIDTDVIPFRAQYAGYRAEPGVASDSETETFFRATVRMDNDRWRGVPFELESGKALNASCVEIEVRFKGRPGNALTFAIQPREGIRLGFNFKRPGFDTALEERDLSFAYADEPAGAPVRDAYERVLYDCIRGDQSLFISTPEIVEEWRITADIISAWQAAPLASYPLGSAPESVQ